MLYHHHLALRPSLWPFAVLLVSIVVDFSRSRTLGRIARQHRSDALAADSVHFATDMWASLAVMVGLAATFAGEHFALPWLEYADPIAAIAVAGVILRASVGASPGRPSMPCWTPRPPRTPRATSSAAKMSCARRADPATQPPSPACSPSADCAPAVPAPATSPM